MNQPSPQKLPTNNRGFAVIIALSLMSFIVLLLLSMTTLVQVETRNASTNLERLKAQQNALLSLYQAIGAVQQVAGDDQRVTASAAFLDSDPSTEVVDGVEDGQKHWTGVWDTTAPTSAPTWLVSGAGASTSPTVPLSNPTILVSQSEAGNLPENEVLVPSVQITEGNSILGEIAWWVADEGIKARYNMPRTPSAGLSRAEIAWQSSLAKTRGIRHLDLNTDGSLGDVGQAFNPELSKLEAVDSLATAALAIAEVTTDEPSDAEESLEPFLHDLTFHSSGVMANTLTGGLRRDLSRGLYDQSNLLSGLVFPENSAIRALQPDGNASSVPTWELMQSYAQHIAGDGTFTATPTIAPRIHSNAQFPHIPGVDQQGVAPILTRATLSMYANLELESGSWAQPGSVYSLNLKIEPAFVIHNPYNVRLEAADYRLSIKAFSRGVSFYTRLRDGSLPTTDPTDPAFIDALNTKFIDRGWLRGNVTDNSGRRKWKDNFTFIARDISLDPGEFTLLTLPAVTEEPLYEDPIDPNELEGGQELQAPGDLGWLSLEIGGPNAPFTFTYEQLKWSGADYSTEFFFWPSNVAPEDYGNPALADLTNAGNSYGATLKFADEEDRFQNTENHMPLSRINRVGSNIWSTKSLRGTLQAEVNQPTAGDGGRTTDVFMVAYDFMAANDYYPQTGASNYYYHRDIHRNTNPRFSFSPNAEWLPSSSSFNDRSETQYFNSRHAAVMTYSPPAINLLGAMDSYGDAPNAVFYEIPTKPLHSIAQLQHVDIFHRHVRTGGPSGSRVGNTQPGYGIGHSFHDHVATNSNRTLTTHLANSGGTGIDGFSDSPSNLVNVEADFIYQANQALWDNFFFSTLQHASTPSVGASTTLEEFRGGDIPNSRVRAVNGESIDEAIFADQVMNMDTAAEFLIVDGTLNVNSTSVPAWRAFISSNLGQDFLIANGAGTSLFDNQEVVFSRSSLANDEPTLTSDGSGSGEYWNGVLGLDALQIDTLARAIVEEIKQSHSTLGRPFLSLAEFINRNRNDQRGLLERAIEKSGIRDNFIQDSTLIGGGGEDATAHYAPGFISQADLLQPLGPFLSTRSDTFRIRARGSSFDPTSGLDTTAICEAVIQRIPDEITAGSNARKFEIVDFRWVSL